MEVNFYNIANHNFDKIFPRLVEMIIARPALKSSGTNKVHIIAKDLIQMEYLDRLLWTYSQLSFLPHATENDNESSLQIVYISYSNSANLNSSNIVINLNEELTQSYFEELYRKKNPGTDIERLILVYNDDEVLEKQLFILRGTSIVCNVIMQDENGNWKKIAKK